MLFVLVRCLFFQVYEFCTFLPFCLTPIPTASVVWRMSTYRLYDYVIGACKSSQEQA
jgi:hypothetical protein